MNAEPMVREQTSNPKSILLVEDEVLIAMAEKSMLESAGYHVVCAASGEKALEISRNDPGIDLALMDIDLGYGMDGTEAAARILQEHEMPIVFWSSHIEPEIIEKTEKTTA